MEKESSTRDIILDECRGMLLDNLPAVIRAMQDLAWNAEREETRLAALVSLTEITMRYRVCTCGEEYCSDPVIQELNRRSKSARS